MSFLLVLCLCVLPLDAMAEGIRPVKASATRLSSGDLAVTTKFDIDLPKVLVDALKDGVTLHFDLEYQIVEPRMLSFKAKLSQFFESDNDIEFKLTYHPLTGNYRVTVGALFTEFPTLDSALKAVGAIANYSLVPATTLASVRDDELKVNVKLSLSTKSLPKPFQINTFTSSTWQLDSGWVPLVIFGTKAKDFMPVGE